MSRGYTIGQLATATGVNVETVRYYQRRKLLAEPKRPPGRTRRYSGADAERLRFIKAAQRLGFFLSEVKDSWLGRTHVMQQDTGHCGCKA